MSGLGNKKERKGQPGGVLGIRNYGLRKGVVGFVVEGFGLSGFLVSGFGASRVSANS